MSGFKVTQDTYSDSYDEALFLSAAVDSFFEKDLYYELRCGYEEMSYINLGIAEEFLTLEDEVSNNIGNG